MRRSLWLTLLAVAAFAVIVLARLPASWVFPSAAGLTCASIDGTVWSGSCSGLAVQSSSLGDLAWDLAPRALLTGKLAAHLVLSHGPLTARGDMDLGLGGGITLRNLRADVPLDPHVLPHVPRELGGTVHTDLAAARIEHGRIVELKGRIEAHDLVQRAVHVTELGSYAVTFPGASGAEPVGTVQDLGGPLAVAGTLRLTPQPGYVLEGEVAARADAAPELVSNLAFLGTPDARGRRPFSFAGTL